MLHTFTISDLRPEETARIAARLDELDMKASVDQLYWLPVPNVLLSALQRSHQAECGPYCLALEVEDDSVSLDLLVRARGNLHCPCIALASAALRAHMIDWLDGFVLAAVCPEPDTPAEADKLP